MSTIKAISNHHNQVCISFKLSEKIPTTVGTKPRGSITSVVLIKSCLLKQNLLFSRLDARYVRFVEEFEGVKEI